MYRQPRLLCTTRNFAQSSKFPGKQNFGTKVYLWGMFKHSPKFEGQTSSGRPTNETLNFQGHLSVLWGMFMALLCFSRWSDQIVCETECAALSTSFQTRPLRALSSFNLFSCKKHILEVTLNISYFSQKFENLQWIFMDNHGHGGHGQVVFNGVFCRQAFI